MIRPRLVTAAVLTAVLGAAAVVAAPSAAPAPTTVTKYPVTGAATIYTGAAFDACTAPPLSTMNAWLGSPYRAIGVYVGGENRSCAQPNLTARWVSDVTALGWSLIPIYFGRQAPCSDRTTATKISTNTATATTQGTDAANDAIAQATALGMSPGSPLYYDMENYDPAVATCRTRAFVSSSSCAFSKCAAISR